MQEETLNGNTRFLTPCTATLQLVQAVLEVVIIHASAILPASTARRCIDALNLKLA